MLPNHRRSSLNRLVALFFPHGYRLQPLLPLQSSQRLLYLGVAVPAKAVQHLAVGLGSGAELPDVVGQVVTGGGQGFEGCNQGVAGVPSTASPVRKESRPELLCRSR